MLKAEYVTSIEQWSQVKELHQSLNDEGWFKRIAYTVKELEIYFLRALQQPAYYGIILVCEEDVPVHMSLVQMIIGDKNCMPQARVFLIASYTKNGTSLKAASVAWNLIQQWGRERNCDVILANVREDASFKALEKRFKLRKAHTVVVADVEYTIPDSCKEVNLCGLLEEVAEVEVPPKYHPEECL
jgi:hypothetical protein